MTQSSFQVIAHRGASAKAPENTFPAFELAVRAGTHGIETDIRATKDGVAVLLHDENVKRTTGVDDLVQNGTWADIQALDAGYLFGRQFTGTRIPRLDDFLTMYLPHLPLQLELKSEDAILPTLKLLRRQLAFNRILLTSFEPKFLKTALAAEPSLQTGLLMNKATDPVDAKKLGCTVAIPNAAQATPDFVHAAKLLGLRVYAWGVKDLAAAQAVLRAGVEGSTYDDPAELLAWLKSNPSA